VQFERVQKSYDGQTLVVKDLNLAIPKGEFLTMLGPSGSGKTTCLMMLAGFETATHGHIRLAGRDINDVPPHKRGIGMVFQNYALFPHMSVAENLVFPLDVRGLTKADKEAKVRRALDMVQMGQFANRRPGQLSGGQQQRIALARALVFEPELVLMDEPLGALDKQLREHMQFEITRLAHNLGITTVYVTHDQTEALTMSDRVAVFNDGVIQQLAPPDELYEAPLNSFVAQFIGENNAMEGVVTQIEGGRCLVRLDSGDEIDAKPARAGGVQPRAAAARRAYAQGARRGVHLHGRHVPHAPVGGGQRRLHHQEPQRARSGPPPAGAGDRDRLAARRLPRARRRVTQDPSRTRAA
jgi:putative spermidine/putrescine transport system ATP-binding protein